jgi:hypothetical protein
LFLLKGHLFTQDALQLWLKGALRTCRKITMRAQKVRLSFSPFRFEPQRFGHIRSGYAPAELLFSR